MTTEDDDLNPDFEEAVARAVAKRETENEAKKNRAKQPKDFGEYLDKVADAVLDRMDQRIAERRAAAEDDDQEPARGEGTSKLAQWWGGEKSA